MLTPTQKQPCPAAATDRRVHDWPVGTSQWSMDDQRKAHLMAFRYPTRVVCVVHRHEDSSTPLLRKRRFVCPNDLILSQLMALVRKYAYTPPDASQGLFLFIGGALVPMQATLRDLHARSADGYG